MVSALDSGSGGPDKSTGLGSPLCSSARHRALTLRIVEFTDRILHLIRETYKKSRVLITLTGTEGLTIRSIRTDR